jgi:hypothetical protein
MDYNKKLKTLNKEKEDLIEQAKKDGYKLIDKELIKSKYIYVIHITMNTIGAGESLGQFELYDKMFKVDEDFVKKAKRTKDLDEFMEEVIFIKDWDDDFRKASIFEDIQLSDWFYVDDTGKSVWNNDIKNIITFRFSYLDSTMGNVSILKCPIDILENHNNIYHYTKSYIYD